MQASPDELEFHLTDEQRAVTGEVIAALWERAISLRSQVEKRLSLQFPDGIDSKRDQSDLQAGLEFHYLFYKALEAKLGLDPEEDLASIAPSCTIFFEHPIPTTSDTQKIPGLYYVVGACSELLLNCQEKGASYIYVYYEEGLLIVIDDIEYDGEDLTALLNRLNQPVVRTTKTGIGGAGIRSTRRDFGPPTGEISSGEGLYYVSDGKRIAAVLRWNPEEVIAYRIEKEEGVHYVFPPPPPPFPFFRDIVLKIMSDREVFREYSKARG